jgi:hypothetical protein
MIAAVRGIIEFQHLSPRYVCERVDGTKSQAAFESRVGLEQREDFGCRVLQEKVTLDWNVSDRGRGPQRSLQ